LRPPWRRFAPPDNAAAIYYNPAGITQIPGTEIRAGLYNIFLDPTFRSRRPGNTGRPMTSANISRRPQLFVSHTLKDFPVSFGSACMRLLRLHHLAR